jgi:hypothetical protein
MLNITEVSAKVLEEIRDEIVEELARRSEIERLRSAFMRYAERLLDSPCPCCGLPRGCYHICASFDPHGRGVNGK